MRPGRDGGASATFYHSNLDSGFSPTQLSNNLATVSSRKRCNSFVVLKPEAPVDRTLNLAGPCLPPILVFLPPTHGRESKMTLRPHDIDNSWRHPIQI